MGCCAILLRSHQTPLRKHRRANTVANTVGANITQAILVAMNATETMTLKHIKSHLQKQRLVEAVRYGRSLW